MYRSSTHLTMIVLTGLLIGCLWTTGAAIGEVASSNGNVQEPGAIAIMPDHEKRVGAEVDCNRSRVNLTAPEDYQYDVTVAVANLTAMSNEVTRSATGSVEGNETIDFTGDGIVLVFVQERSGDEEIVATEVTSCLADTDEVNATTRPNEGDPAIQIDCAENDVRFTAPEGRAYVAKVVGVTVSPTQTSTRSVTQTHEGNATVSLEEGTLVAAFASTGELGDDRTVSAIRNCSSYGSERTLGNGNHAENGDDGLERR